MIVITTPVAKFQLHKVTKVAISIGNQIAMGQRYALREPSWHVEVYNDADAGVLAFESGPMDIIPKVWSHTPFTWGMNPEAIQAKFEERAVDVLSDYGSVPDFIKCSPESGIVFKDNRYYCDGLRGAWMMYVDAHIEFFNNK